MRDSRPDHRCLSFTKCLHAMPVFSFLDFSLSLVRRYLYRIYLRSPSTPPGNRTGCPSTRPSCVSGPTSLFPVVMHQMLTLLSPDPVPVANLVESWETSTAYTDFFPSTSMTFSIHLRVPCACAHRSSIHYPFVVLSMLSHRWLYIRHGL